MMKTIARWSLIFVILIARMETLYAMPRVAVRQFEDRTQEKDAPASAVMDMMVTELDKAGVFELVERERLDHIAEELKLSQQGLVDPSMVLEVGRLHSAQYSMEGAITLYYYHEKGSGFVLPIIGSATVAKTAYVQLEIRIVDNTTGRIVYSSEQLGSSRQDAKGSLGGYKGFFIGGYKRTYGGILASATRDAVMKHVAAIKARNWE
ncbi:MAG: hypothetical protein IJG51_07345 [Synergistaceae bacterium]|nr:hypothetical protein [Synergistaceae bacterium]MBQ3398685.1 hypothetical protein [Synergistaceae bacterium]MBQ3760187.1 hypothetical protein [Synergistaceae bacterium]MBQ6418169.1 hypothetical protein [Synergistaceae bacterium]MBQ6664620.1 hypothetical protein [Synergistaceae bacterium]